MSKDIFKKTIADIDGDRGHIQETNTKRPVSSLKKWSVGLVCVFASAALYSNMNTISSSGQNHKPSIEKPRANRRQVPSVVTPPEASFNYIVVKAPNGLNVRTGPAQRFNSVGKLKNGSCIKYAEPSYKSGWQTFHLTIIGGRSENTDGIQVYLSENYLQKTNRPDHRCSGTITLRQQYKHLGR